MTGFLRAAGIAALLGTGLAGSARQVESAFTDLDPRRCRLISQDRSSGDWVRRCRGAGGYALLVEDSDLRVSVTVVAPSRRRFPLNYRQVVTSALSTLGERAEWRIERHGRRRTPVAVIVPVHAYEEADFPHRIRPYLAVAKLGPDTVCVTQRIAPGPTALEEARRAADQAPSSACLSTRVSAEVP